jgi:hypothetical protein
MTLTLRSSTIQSLSRERNKMETIEGLARMAPWFVRFTAVSKNSAESQSRQAWEPASDLCVSAWEGM